MTTAALISKHDLQRLITQNPNDPRVLNALQQHLASPATGEDGIGLLFELYQHPALHQEMKGLVSTLVMSLLRHDVAQVSPASIGLNPEHQAFKMIYRGLGHHLDMAFAEIDLVSKLQRDALDKTTSPKFVIAIPKSGSSLLGICLGNMIKLSRGGSLDNNAFMFRGYPSWWNVGDTHDWDLRPEIGADPLFRQYPGGVYKGHVAPSPKNLEILKLYKESRYLITIRDPRDQFVAHYCQQRRIGVRQVGNTSTDDTSRKELVQADVVDFMKSGKLFENLMFIGQWLALRDKDRSRVVAYEKLMSEPVGVLEAVSNHFDLALGKDQVLAVYQYAQELTNRTQGSDQSGQDQAIYPLGWTGASGVWKTYFSQEACSVFEETMQSFNQLTPWGQLIQEHYPSLASASLNA